MRHLFVSDLDGTLLDSTGHISPETATSVAGFIARGGAFTLATARSLTSARQWIDALELRLPVVLFNGVYVYDPSTDTNVVAHHLSTDIARELLDVMKAMALRPFVHATSPSGEARVFHGELVNPSEVHYVEGRTLAGDHRFRRSEAFNHVFDHALIQLMAVGTPSELAEPARRLRERDDITVHYTSDIYCPGYYWLEVSHVGISKGAAVRELAAIVGATEITCMGDNLNDLSMFEVADTSVAVANAVEEVRARADRVIASNDQHGIARYLDACSP